MMHCICAFARYFYTMLHLGTPPRQFAVIVDSGSTITSVSCASCGSSCGLHHKARPALSHWALLQLRHNVLLSVIDACRCRTAFVLSLSDCHDALVVSKIDQTVQWPYQQSIAPLAAFSRHTARRIKAVCKFVFRCFQTTA